MALPASYTESTLRDYMLSVVASAADGLGLDVGDFTEAVNDVLIAYGVTDIASAADIAKLRALAKVEAWRTVVNVSAADYEFTADGANYKRQQVHSQAVAALARAEAQVAVAYPVEEVTYNIEMGSMVFNDAYGRPNAGA